MAGPGSPDLGPMRCQTAPDLGRLALAGHEDLIIVSSIFRSVEMPICRELNTDHSAVLVLRNAALAGALSICTLWLCSAAVPTLQAQEPEVPVVKADVGPCSADFTVADSESKPIYDAKIQVRVRYGFMSKRKTDLEVGSNSNGKARIEGLPEKGKKPLVFRVRHDKFLKSVEQDPASDCHADFAVVLGEE
jgi:hypothetical protein